MALLIVAFRDGFADDLVVVRVNDREVFREEGVTTNLMRGYADSLEVQVPEDSVEVEVILPSRNLSETIMLEVTTEVYLGLSIRGSRIEHQISDEPFKQL